ncbi:plasmid-related lipoprotein [Campylobacter hyointestinalis]|uniref:EexN family lipoprotein n=1 Tax=Campylobacter hyointestinalis TaxID=198 RepID=UPI00072C3870|nr:EexN family lipoprotein [Campylobacter hyointestinalis]CUU75040.1 plasmid-related lipoprotein [Campylobacter hyointestinalis]
MKLKFLTPVIGSLVVVGFLSGCSEEKAKTVEYYKQNIPEAEARQKECKAAKELTQIQIEDCKNVGAALYAESFKKGPGDDSRVYSLEESKKRLGF